MCPMDLKGMLTKAKWCYADELAATIEDAFACSSASNGVRVKGSGR